MQTISSLVSSIAYEHKPISQNCIAYINPYITTNV